MTVNDKWISDVEQAIQRFAARHSVAYSRPEREVSASFEIGCFHALIDFYEAAGAGIGPANLTLSGEYRYLTTPNGDPRNFSHVRATIGQEECEIRQQVRVRSHMHPDITVTPDLVVLKKETEIADERDKDYAGGKRGWFYVDSVNVIAAHECKSMNPFPELLVSYLGILLAVHAWFDGTTARIDPTGPHLAPTLFVGGTARALHGRMVGALESCYPINVVLGMHAGNWNLLSKRRIKGA